MNQFFIDNEQKTNRLLINIYWAAAFLAYISFLGNRIVNANSIPYSKLTFGFLLTVVLGITLELGHFYFDKRGNSSRVLKYYILTIIMTVVYYLLYMSGDPFILGLYFCPVIAAALYYNYMLITYMIILDFLSIVLLISSGYLDLNFKPSLVGFYTDIFASLIGCLIILVAYLVQSRKIVEKVHQQENALMKANEELKTSNASLKEAYNELIIKQQETVALNQALEVTNEKLETTNRELSEKQEELIALNEEIMTSNQELEKTYAELYQSQQEVLALNHQLEASNIELQEAYNELTLKQQEVITLNHALTVSKDNLEKAYNELNASQQETEAINEELLASNQSLEEAYNDLSIKQQEVIALNQALTDSNEKLENAYNELNANQQEIVALNQELIATNDTLEEAFNELKQVQIQLVQNEKMASLGQLAAGIAHEINTPMGAINCNVDLAKRFITIIKEHIADLQDQKAKESLIKLEELNQINIMASERIVKIVKSLKSFARLDSDQYQETDIHKDLDNTLILANNKLKNRIEVIKEYGEIPQFKCYASQLNQVFMNLIVNAADAIADTGKIWIKTYAEADKVYISIKDNGMGIKAEHLERIFDPGFTTKGVGVGTGLGLAIAYNIIEKHQGKISVKSEYGEGTEFIIKLPIRCSKLY